MPPRRVERLGRPHPADDQPRGAHPQRVGHQAPQRDPTRRPRGSLEDRPRSAAKPAVHDARCSRSEPVITDATPGQIDHPHVMRVQMRVDTSDNRRHACHDEQVPLVRENGAGHVGRAADKTLMGLLDRLL